MAGVITHLVIGREMLKLLPEGTIKDYGLFYLGTLAPDAVHAREGYVRAHKKHTHFRDDIADRDFELPQMYALYKSRLIDFINENKDRGDELLDLYRGYVVHILTDELFVLSIRKEFCDIMSKQGIDQNDRAFFDYIVTDMNRNDMLLVYQYEGMEELKEFMEEVSACPVSGYLSEQEMSDCRDWLVHQHFYLEHERLEPIYISYERMMSFIKEAAATIVERLSEGGNFPKMF
jgi:hypothetical protein